jgi:NADH dehydrogenase FAD-containing subunit
METRHRIVILGGGFAGVYAALELDREFASRSDVQNEVVRFLREHV